MGSIWSASAVTPAATDRIPVDVSSSGAPSRWTGQNVADAASRIGVTLNALGSINSNTEIDLANGAFVTATITGSLTFTFSNPPATGQGMQFVLVLTDGGSAVVTWPGAVTWTGGTAPTLRASGVDVLRFYTSNGGTNWYGELAYDEQSIDAGAILTGTIDTARLGSGTANSGTFLRGDQTWAAVSASPGGSSGQAQYNDAGAFAGLPVWREDANTVAQRNGSTAQVAYYYRDATDTSNYERLAILPGAAAGWMQIVAQTAGTGADNFGVALTPAGTGAISAHVPDSTSAGGNARGASSVDLQLNRIAATQVCGGAYSGILSGYSNSIAASALYSVIGGGSSNSISNSYYGVVAGGYNNIASETCATVSGGGTNTASGADSWIPGGQRATTRGLKGAYAYSAGRRSANGDAQVIGQPVRRTTTDATPVSLATDGTPAATTVMVLPANSTLIATATVVARDSSGNSAGWIAQALFKRDGSNNTTRLGSATVTAIGTPDAAINTATIDLVANDTLEAAEIQVTGVAATTIYWVGELKCVQVA